MPFDSMSGKRQRQGTSEHSCILGLKEGSGSGGTDDKQKTIFGAKRSGFLCRAQRGNGDRGLGVCALQGSEVDCNPRRLEADRERGVCGM